MCQRVSAKLSSLRTYPLKEADLVVSFLTRDQGKLRGVAKRARRPKSAFGAGLERLSHVRMAYFQRETRELVNLDSCELIQSQFGLASDYWAGVALDYFAEVAEQLLPAAEAEREVFPPAAGCAGFCGSRQQRRAVSGARPRISRCGRCGFRAGLPELHVCWLAAACWTIPERALLQPRPAGLICGHCRRTTGAGNSWELSAESRVTAGRDVAPAGR